MLCSRTKTDYYIYCDLKSILERKGMTRGRFAILTGLKYDTINRYYHNYVQNVDLSVLARICIALECEVGDIFKIKSYDRRVL